MKTIFRSTSFVLLFAAVLALGAVAGFAQDPCGDAEGQTAAGDKFRELYPKKDISGRKAAIEAGKQFLEKYGSCEPAKELSEYLKTTLPKMETNLAKVEKDEKIKEIVVRFNAGLKSKNWDDLYAAGKQLLTEDGEKYRPAVLVMGSIGLDETAKSPRVTKWNDDTIKFAKLAIADLEGGKTFSSLGFQPFEYKNKEDALAWMNYTIGYIYAFDKNNKKESVTYLYKASQAVSDTKSNPVVFESIGAYYFEDARKLITEISAMPKAAPSDTPEVAQQKLDAFKAKVGILNGTVERALDAYSRAYKLSPDTPAGKAYRDGLYKTLGELYDVRFEKKEGLDTWINTAVTKPLPNPSSAITPINDPEPITTTSTTTPVTPTPVTTPIKPAAPAPKPPVNGKPQSVVTNAAVKTSAAAVTAKPSAKAVAKKKGTR